jgi:glycosyltransferase involved in cell wall biosynthesis
MKVSLITVCYNSAKTIEDTIKSVQSQTYPDIEYIVIDGGSSDATKIILSKYKSDIDVLVCEPDEGIYDAMNKGIRMASGDIIGMLNSDDFYPDLDVLTHVSNEFKRHPEADMVMANVDFVDPSDLTKLVRTYSSFGFSPWMLRFGFMPAHPGTFIKKSAYELVGEYKLGYKIGADFDMFVRMLLIYKLQYAKLNKTLVRMRVGGVSTSGISSYVLTTKEMLRSLNENKVYSNVIMVLVRLPVKFFQMSFLKLKN